MTPSEIFQLFFNVIWSAALFGLSTGFLLAFIGKR